MPASYTAEQSYYIRSSPSKVFDSLTNPRGLVKWFLTGATLSPKPGGAFAFDWIGGYHMDGKVLAYSKGRSVSFLWVDRLPNGRLAETTVAFRLRRKGKGTVLHLRHSGFRVPAHFAECASRWAYYLTNLKSVLDHGQDLRSEWDW